MGIIKNVLPSQSVPSHLTLFEKNQLLVDAIEDIFGFSKVSHLDDLKNKMTATRIKDLYENARIFPSTTEGISQPALTLD